MSIIVNCQYSIGEKLKESRFNFDLKRSSNRERINWNNIWIEHGGWESLQWKGVRAGETDK